MLIDKRPASRRHPQRVHPMRGRLPIGVSEKYVCRLVAANRMFSDSSAGRLCESAPPLVPVVLGVAGRGTTPIKALEQEKVLGG